ncbi:IS1380 family transposase [Micromonospora sonchi]|uniref:IS1380 family transposase n=1 Tax=Micromonospora sonchi TaxID=1763543 RepID=UPI001E5AA4E3|nr:IS1380 family transposase [Micromonospora sonchi]
MGKGSGWDQRLVVGSGGKGLVGHAGAVLLRKCADRSGLTSGLNKVLPRGAGPGWWDRGTVLVSLAVAIVLGATSMSDIALLAHQSVVFGDRPSESTVRRALAGLDETALKRIGTARAKVRAHVWALLARRRQGFPWLSVAGKLLTGWVVIDLDATLITAHSDKQGAAATFKKGYGFHPLGAWCANTAECLAMLLRPGNAGSNTVADHIRVLGDAIAQLPAGYRRKLLIRVDGAGATHELLEHLEQMNRVWRSVKFTVGWTITAADETAIAQLPADAWTDSLHQDGTATSDAHVAELTGLNTRLAGWTGTLRLLVRRVKPSARHVKNLTELEKRTGWRYQIVATNITRIARVPGSHQPQWLDALHRAHAGVEDQVRAGKAMGLRNLPSKTWTVNRGWVLAANIATDLTAWTRLLGLHDQPDLAHAEPDTLRYRLLHLPAKLATHARRRVLSIPETWPWADAFTLCWQRLTLLPPAT